jgi:hypothetical protein
VLPFGAVLARPQEEGSDNAQLSPDIANYDLRSPSMDTQGTEDSRIGCFSPPRVARGINMDYYSAPRATATISNAHDSAEDQHAGSDIPSQAYMQEVQSCDQGSVDQQAAAPASKAPRAP